MAGGQRGGINLGENTMSEHNIILLEGAQYKMRVKLTDEAGQILNPAHFRVYGGAYCPGFAQAQFHAERTEEEWLLTMPGLKQGRVPWSWQLIAAEVSTGVEWLLASGEVEPVTRHAAGAGYIDPGELAVLATLDKTTLQITVTLGESTAECSLAVVDARQSAAGAAASAQASAISAGESAASAEAAAGSATAAAASATAAEASETAAESSADDASASAADAQTYSERAERNAQQAATSAADSAASAAMAAGSASTAESYANTAQSAAQTAAADAVEAAKPELEGYTTAAANHAADAETSSAAAAGSASDAIEAASGAAGSAAAAASSASSAGTYAQQTVLEAAKAAASAEDAAENAAVAIEHAADEAIHVTGTEHEHLKRLIAAFPEVDPDVPPATPPAIPEEALAWSVIEGHFAQNAQPGVTQAPGHVFASRVPWAWWDETAGTWKNNACAVDEAALGIARKLWDNAGLNHTCSTDTVLGADDYIGKRWAFYCGLCNYMTDEYGIKHVTAIQGYSLNGAEFDETKNTGAFGTAFWYFCVLEKYQDSDGNWLTHDGTESGTPLYQLWGISDRPWAELDEGRRAELEAHGVSESDFSLWPECQVYSEADGGLVQRPYWVHSAYCGGYEQQADGTVALVSKKNAPLYKNLSYQTFNGIYGYNAAAGGGACVNGFGMLFDIVKNATKNSQAIHAGMAQNYCSAVRASVSTSVADYVFPISAKGNFDVGCTVWIWQKANASDSTNMVRSTDCQIGRVIAIETRTVQLEDGTEAESLCLVFDPDTVEPFIVRTGSDNAAAIAAAKEMSDAGYYCHAMATQGQAMGGETAMVLGKHDGSVTSNTNSRHPYRVQLTEYMPGALILAADTVAVKGNGTQAVEVDGEVLVPTSAEYVILTAPPTVARLSSGSLAQFLDAGYVAAGISPATSSSYILNERLSPVYGVAYPVAVGGSGSGSGTGHADQMWVGASPAEFLSGGYLSHGAAAGSAALNLNGALGYADWHFAARD